MADKKQRYKYRKERVRRKLFLSGILKPRLAAYRSLRYIYAQIVDDSKGVTLVHASTLGKELKEKYKSVFLNLLNRNPDRYVSATVSQGPQEKTLAVNYNVYEADPWHYFAQVDNSGTDNIQWKPRFGLINTNLLGFDDKLTAIYQVPLESDWNEE